MKNNKENHEYEACGSFVEDREAKVSSCCCRILIPVEQDHEPPIGVGEGSTFFDLPNPITLSNPISVVGDPYFTYRFLRASGAAYTRILKITVLTEGGSDNPESQMRGGVSFCTYEFPETEASPGLKVELRLWLEYVRFNNPSSVGDPDIVVSVGRIQGKTDGGSIRTKVFLGNRLRSEKQKRTYRHLHPSPQVAPIPDFRQSYRVHKWAITDERGNVVALNGKKLEAANDDMYYFYLTFDH